MLLAPNIEAEIERAKTKPYELVLASLGITGVGKRAAKLIVSKIPSFKRLRDIATVDIKGVGPSTIDSILSWLDGKRRLGTYSSFKTRTKCNSRGYYRYRVS